MALLELDAQFAEYVSRFPSWDMLVSSVFFAEGSQMVLLEHDVRWAEFVSRFPMSREMLVSSACLAEGSQMVLLERDVRWAEFVSRFPISRDMLVSSACLAEGSQSSHGLAADLVALFSLVAGGTGLNGWLVAPLYPLSLALSVSFQHSKLAMSG
jgi:hypothetical protein